MHEKREEQKYIVAETYLALLQHHKVEVLNALVGILLDPIPKEVFRYDFSDIFVYEVVTGRYDKMAR